VFVSYMIFVFFFLVLSGECCHSATLCWWGFPDVPFLCCCPDVLLFVCLYLVLFDLLRVLHVFFFVLVFLNDGFLPDSSFLLSVYFSI